jgi:hypothetical protein
VDRRRSEVGEPGWLHAKYRILRFSLGGHPPAGAALGILPARR